jgi:RimJ/RimL family protein N-acetyltransferase
MPLAGSWVELAPLGEAPEGELARLAALRRLTPEMGSPVVAEESPVPALLVLERSSRRPVGIVESHWLPGAIAVFLIYLDPERARAGYGMEASAIYISRLFDGGARRVSAEVLDFNRAMHGIFRKVHLEPSVRMAEHVYVAGAFRDLLVYSFDRPRWLRMIARYRAILPGGRRTMVAVGGSPRVDFGGSA